MSLPIRRQKFNVQGFLAYLAANGCEIGTPTNPYELVRYKAYHDGGKRPVTQIVYTKDSGLLTWMGATQGHYLSFLDGRPLPHNGPPYQPTFSEPPRAGKPAKNPLPKSAKVRAKLIERDGAGCWFCGNDLGEDATIEHLIPKSKGGPNSLANYVLAHRQCNADAADLPLVEKIAMHVRNREPVT